MLAADLLIPSERQRVEQRLANDASIGLAFLNIKILRVNGIETLKEVRDACPGLKIVIITGYKNVEIETEATNFDADEYITKPFRPEEILKAVKKR